MKYLRMALNNLNRHVCIDELKLSICTNEGHSVNQFVNRFIYCAKCFDFTIKALKRAVLNIHLWNMENNGIMVGVIHTSLGNKRLIGKQSIVHVNMV